ncbi:hypothetical protein D9C73_024720 [Collichthys lucidus]|uniref:Uncharacterized protein n=1 Tax=Collichthys lucidus TaxID=240159 RepID=A0A4U5VPS3_COLLU|nr:hypothetical protein D9C73_024720 [Collichthys lucidus]
MGDSDGCRGNGDSAKPFPFSANERSRHTASQASSDDVRREVPTSASSLHHLPRRLQRPCTSPIRPSQRDKGGGGGGGGGGVGVVWVVVVVEEKKEEEEEVVVGASGLYSCLDRGALGNPGDRRFPQIFEFSRGVCSPPCTGHISTAFCLQPDDDPYGSGVTGYTLSPEIQHCKHSDLQHMKQHGGRDMEAKPTHRGPSDAEHQRHRGVATSARVSLRSRGRVNRRGMLSEASELICLIFRQTLVSASDQDDRGLLGEEERERTEGEKEPTASN